MDPVECLSTLQNSVSTLQSPVRTLLSSQGTLLSSQSTLVNSAKHPGQFSKLHRDEQVAGAQNAPGLASRGCRPECACRRGLLAGHESRVRGRPVDVLRRGWRARFAGAWPPSRRLRHLTPVLEGRRPPVPSDPVHLARRCEPPVLLPSRLVECREPRHPRGRCGRAAAAAPGDSALGGGAAGRRAVSRARAADGARALESSRRLPAGVPVPRSRSEIVRQRDGRFRGLVCRVRGCVHAGRAFVRGDGADCCSGCASPHCLAARVEQARVPGPLAAPDCDLFRALRLPCAARGTALVRRSCGRPGALRHRERRRHNRRHLAHARDLDPRALDAVGAAAVVRSLRAVWKGLRRLLDRSLAACQHGRCRRRSRPVSGARSHGRGSARSLRSSCCW